MRFGKRDRSQLLWGRARRSARTQPVSAAGGPVEAEERNALLNPGARQVDLPPTPEPVVHPGGDPTQELMTTLGRFQRHVARAEAGAGQEVWSDDCMDELVGAVEISLAQNWAEVVESLAGTGRVLRTYEEAGCANLCVPFLSESYEILCLMVGDLIVGNVRPGVIRKWRDCYVRAVNEIAVSGLTLVNDNGDDRSKDESYQRDVPPQIRAMETPAEGPIEAPAPVDDTMQPAIDVPEPPTPDTLQTIETTPEPEIDVPEPPAPVLELVSETEVEPPPMPSVDEAQEPEPQEETRSEDETAKAPAEPTLTEDGIASGVADTLDALSDDLARIEYTPQRDPAPLIAAFRDKVATLEVLGAVADRAGCAELCQIMGVLSELACDADRGHDERFLEAAFGFCEAYGQAFIAPETPISEDWSIEARALIEDWQPPQAVAVEAPQEPEAEAPPQAPEEEQTLAEQELVPAAEEEPAPYEAMQEAEVPEPESEPEVEPEPEVEAEVEAEPEEEIEEQIEAAVESEEELEEQVEPEVEPAPYAAEPEEGAASLRALLQTAEQAVSEGNVSDAKILVLRAAANLSSVETAKAEARVGEIEMLLKQGCDAVEAARERVKEAEQGVAEAELHVAEGEEAREEAGTQVAQLIESRQAIEQRVTELDERIRELQAQRVTEAERAVEAGAEVDVAQERAVAAEEALGRLAEAEQASRVHQEDARQEVKNIQRRQSETELALDQARQTLVRQRSSLADIEKTIAQVGGGAVQEQDDSEGLLF